MAAVAGDEQVGHRRQGGAAAPRCERDEPEQADRVGPQAQPQPAERPSARRPSAASPEHRDRARAGDACAPAAAARRAQAGRRTTTARRARQHRAAGAGLQRHDDEGRQRNGDDVGGDAVEAGLVEMVQRERDQRDLDRQAGQDQRRAGCAASRAGQTSSSRR